LQPRNLARKFISLKVTGFWNVVPCSLVEVNRRFRVADCLFLIFEAVRTSELSIYLKESTLGNIP
jgi:hypothetical protein